MNREWPKGLPYPTSWLRAIALNATFFGIIYLFWQHIKTARDIEKLATVAWFCQIPLMVSYHYAAVQLAEHLEGLRPVSQNTRPLGSWQHWKEGLAGFIVLFLALVVTAPIADAIAPISYSIRYHYVIDQAFFIYAILSAIASAYLYYWKIPSRVKSIVVFSWPLIDTYLKTQLVLFIPLIISLPIVASAVLVSKLNLSEIFLFFGFFLAVIMWLFATAAAFAAIHYYGAHWANWIASWWPESFPGYGYFQQKKAQRHNASVNQSFIYHETSWKLAAHDFTVLIYANVLSNIASIPIYLRMSGESSTEILEALGVALYLILWLAQRITARTNVRREGETDWTKAGEIPELADFLRSKS